MKIIFVGIAFYLFAKGIYYLTVIYNANYGTLVNCYPRCEIFIAGVNFQDLMTDITVASLITLLTFTIELSELHIPKIIERLKERNTKIDEFI